MHGKKREWTELGHQVRGSVSSFKEFGVALPIWSKALVRDMPYLVPILCLYCVYMFSGVGTERG